MEEVTLRTRSTGTAGYLQATMKAQVRDIAVSNQTDLGTQKFEGKSSVRTVLTACPQGV